MAYSIRLAMFILCLIPLTGCTSKFLRRRTNAQISTLTDLTYKQVMENIAMFECNPESLAHFAVITSGLSQATDGINGGGNINWTLEPRYMLSAGGSRNRTENWTLEPIQESGKLARLSCLFKLIVTGYQPIIDEHGELVNQSDEFTECINSLKLVGVLPEFNKPAVPEAPTLPIQPQPIEGESEDAFKVRLKKYNEELKTYTERTYPRYLVQVQTYQAELQRLVPQYRDEFHKAYQKKIPYGWYRVGKNHDAPKNACLVAHSGCKTVWVPAGGMAGLRQISLTALTLAQTIPPTIDVQVEADNVTYKGPVVGSISDYIPKTKIQPSFFNLFDGRRAILGQPYGRPPRALPPGDRAIRPLIVVPSQPALTPR